MTSVNTHLAAWNSNQEVRGWRDGKVRPLQGNAPQGRILRGPDFQPLKERLRRSHHTTPSPCFQRTLGRPACVFGGMAESISPMWLNGSPNPGAEADCLPLVGPESQVEERAGRNTLLLIVRMSSGRLSLDRVGRHQSPSPFHRHGQINTHSQMRGCKGDISTLHRWGHFYFALTGQFCAGVRRANNRSSARYRWASGAVEVSTRSGANALCGSLYEFLRSDKFDRGVLPAHQKNTTPQLLTHQRLSR